jgi:hypothetical protein
MKYKDRGIWILVLQRRQEFSRKNTHFRVQIFESRHDKYLRFKFQRVDGISGQVLHVLCNKEVLGVGLAK